MAEFRPGSFQILPLIIKNLLIINALVFLVQITFGPANIIPINDWFALHDFNSPLFKPHQLLTHMFMHGGFGHLFFNMFALWMFGSVLENYWGPKRFLMFFLLCGLGAALIHMAVLYYGNIGLVNDLAMFKAKPSFANFELLYRKYGFNQMGTGVESFLINWKSDPTNIDYAEFGLGFVKQYAYYFLNQPTLGASGAVFGALAAFGMLFPNSYIYLYFFFPMKAKYFVLLYAGFELFMGVKNSAGDNVAHWAHLGGALVGFLLVYYWRRTDRQNFY